uniref:Uncharacterized protein n=1 Tax=Salix viminalis TaxID=40686 RepID=A0A6N2KLV5_SALVM
MEFESEWWHDSSRLRQSVFICLVVATSILMVAVAEPIFKQKGLSYNETQKGMITGAATTTVFYNLRLRHPTLEHPYNLALLFQPMLILGISIGVTLNVLFVDWMIIIMVIIFFIAEEKPLPGGATSHDQIKPKSIKEELYGFSSLSSPTSSLQQLQSSLVSLSLAGEKQKTQRWKGEEEKNGETERVET